MKSREKPEISKKDVTYKESAVAKPEPDKLVYYRDSIGPRIKKMVDGSGKSYREIGEEVGVSFTTISKVIKGAGIELYTLQRITDACGVKLTELLKGL